MTFRVETLKQIPSKPTTPPSQTKENKRKKKKRNKQKNGNTLAKTKPTKPLTFFSSFLPLLFVLQQLHWHWQYHHRQNVLIPQRLQTTSKKHQTTATQPTTEHSLNDREIHRKGAVLVACRAWNQRVPTNVLERRVKSIVLLTEEE